MLDLVMVWEHEGRRYQYVSTYCLPEDSWFHELTGLDDAAFACVVIPDVTPDGTFTPAPSSQVALRFAECSIPWPIWTQFLAVVHESGDLVDP